MTASSDLLIPGITSNVLMTIVSSLILPFSESNEVCHCLKVMLIKVWFLYLI